MIDIKIEPPIKKIDDTIADSMNDNASITETFSDPVTINESMNDPVISLDVAANLKDEVIYLKEETDDTKQESTFLTEIEESVEETTKELSISEFVADIEDNNEVQLEKEPTENSEQFEEFKEETKKELPFTESIGEIEDKDEVQIEHVMEIEPAKISAKIKR